MKSNSCLWRAVNLITKTEWGIEIPSDVFDKNNTGQGVPTIIAASTINEALKTFGLCVTAIYGDIIDSHLLDHPELLKPSSSFLKLETPCIGFTSDHAEPFWMAKTSQGEFKLVMTIGKLN